jgi:PAS domain S-box-containing protein
VFKDISYNKKLEQQLKQSEERYRDLFENANDPMYTIDTSGYFQSMNNSALQILGVTKEEIIGSHMSSLLTEESYAIALDILKKQISCQPFEQPIILEIICKNGEHHWGEFKSRIIKDGSKIIGVHGIGRDITEKKKLEEQLKEYHEKLKKSYEELKETEKLKNEFISNITHELMTPLTSIKGYSELLYNDALGKTSFKQKGSLEVILRNSERLMSRIQDLLDIAALENDEILFNHNSVSINEIINESIQDLEPKLLTKEIDVIKNTAISSSIPGDKEKLLQVITNILSNAIKFTSNKGKITITVSEDQDEIKISIKDTGIGIPEDKLERVFDRFFQVDSSSSRKYGGFGLGLSICRSIVEKHNGLIWAESNGNGSTFNIALPKITSKQKGKLNVGTRP